jgi:hypothetical protein
MTATVSSDPRISARGGLLPTSAINSRTCLVKMLSSGVSGSVVCWTCRTGHSTLGVSGAACISSIVPKNLPVMGSEKCLKKVPLF